MGSAVVQGDLWGAKAADWAELGEPVSRPVVEAVFERAGVGEGARLADLGCGAGMALAVAHARGAQVTGLDASPALVEVARSRVPGARIEIGDLEELPFDDASFDVVTGFNSFQFAGDVAVALREAARVSRPGGSVTMCVWGPPEECESVAHSFAPVMAMLPPPPPSPRPPLSTPGVVEGLLKQAGLTPVDAAGVDIPFRFPDAATTWRAFSSAGIMVGAIRQLGEEKVRRTILGTLGPFTRTDGSVEQKNRFYWTMARRSE